MNIINQTQNFVNKCSNFYVQYYHYRGTKGKKIYNSWELSRTQNRPQWIKNVDFNRHSTHFNFHSIFYNLIKILFIHMTIQSKGWTSSYFGCMFILWYTHRCAKMMKKKDEIYKKAFVIFILKEKYILSLYNHQYILNDIHKKFIKGEEKTKNIIVLLN